MMNREKKHLLLPIQIDALTVTGRNWRKDRWTSLAPRYAALKNTYRPQLRDLFIASREEDKPKPGIHLHFRLPSFFTHATGTDSSDFPRIPNRWLVQRIFMDGSHPATAWMVYSDQVDDAGVCVPGIARGATNRHETPLDLRARGARREVQSIKGGVSDFDERDTAAEIALTAVTGGDPGFSAHYPACRSILGFHDDPPCDSGRISYLVTGWYSSSDDDPWSAFIAQLPAADAERQTAIQKWIAAHGCQLASDKALPDALLCHGLVEDIAWNRRDESDEYQHFHQKKSYTTILGNSTAEAIAVRLAPDGGTMDAVLVEDCAIAAQSGLLSSDPSLTEIDAELHRNQFVAINGGTVWSIGEDDSGTAREKERISSRRLPEALQHDLCTLNRWQKECDRFGRLNADYRAELHALWQRWTAALALEALREPHEDKQVLKRNLDALKQFLSGFGALPKVATAFEQRALAEADLRRAIEQLRAPAYRLTRESSQPFYAPKDPVLLITGPATDAQQTGRNDKVAICRITDDVLTDFTESDERGDPVVRSGEQCSQRRGAGAAYRTSIPQSARRLLYEACLLNEMADRPLSGKDPLEIGVFRWKKNPWLPLAMIWDVEWCSDYASGTTPEALVTSRWRLNSTDLGGSAQSAYLRTADFMSEPLPASGQAKDKQQGWSLLTRPRVASGTSELGLALSSRLDTPMLSQALGALHDGLTMRRPGDALPPIDFERWLAKPHQRYVDAIEDELWPAAAPYIQRADGLDTVPATDRPFYPIRSGTLRLKRLWIVDAFGRYVELEGEGTFARLNSSRLNASTPAQTGEALLRPRFARPMRLNFSPAEAGNPLEIAPASSPICGWVVPNHLDQNLTLYAANGRPICGFQKPFGVRPGERNSYFYRVDIPGEQTVIAAPNAHLHAFDRFIGSLDVEQGEALNRLLDRAIRSTRKRMPSEDGPSSVLVGRPLVLVRATLQLETFGLPALHQTRSWMLGDAKETILNMLKEGFDQWPQGALHPLLETGNAEHVTWPLRLGDVRSLNDGLVGFFVGAPGSGPFYTSWGLELENTDQGMLASLQQLQLDSLHPITVTLLMDPRARVHATLGALPRTFLELPGLEAAAKAVREVFFQTAPVLGEVDTPQIPRPSDEFGVWSWAHRTGVTAWQEDPSFVSATDRAGFAVPYATITEGWLKLKTDPVRIESLWIKDPPVKANRNFTLKWKVRGARVLRLYKIGANASREEPPLYQSENMSVFEKADLNVQTRTVFELEASDGAGYEDTMRIEVGPEN